MSDEPVTLTVDPPVVVVHVADGAPDWSLGEIKAAALAHPGDYQLALRVGRHTLTFGPAWTVDPTPELAAALEEYGRIEVIDASPATAGQDQDEAGGAGPVGHVPIDRPAKEVDRDGDD